MITKDGFTIERGVWLTDDVNHELWEVSCIDWGVIYITQVLINEDNPIDIEYRETFTIDKTDLKEHFSRR